MIVCIQFFPGSVPAACSYSSATEQHVSGDRPLKTPNLLQEWVQDIRLTGTVSLLHSGLMIRHLAVFAATEARWVDVSYMRRWSALDDVCHPGTQGKKL